jgi:transposase
MPRVAVTFNVTNEQLNLLNKIVNSKKAERRLYERAQIILLSINGSTNQQIAKSLSLTESTVGKWRNRYAKLGLSGLEDAARSGKPKTYTDNTRTRILKELEKAPPKGQANWDGRALAASLDISADAVWRILKKENISLQRTRSWCVSTDKEFAQKSADIVGLYLNPPENALVICIDEKPSIQAIERKRGYVETSSRKTVQGLQSTYKRHGTLNLFAALNVATGAINASTTTQKTRVEFLAFMDTVIKDVQDEHEVHVILDNYCTHKKNDDWLLKHPNVKFHYTPTSASWLNMVEIWFGIFSRKALKNASFDSTDSLKNAINDYVKVYGKSAKPFVWRKREVHGSQLRNTIANLCN